MAKGGKYLVGMIFSFSGFVFLMIVGALLKLQPQFMHLAKKPKSTANSCFEAAGLYAACTVLFFFLYRRSKVYMSEDSLPDSVPRDRSYYEIEDSEEELPLARHMSPLGRTYTLSPSSASGNVRSSM
ncbi:hypothetical protein Poli38472_009084 [Pythium oligandrum]|uniref:Uncharacterized protein n=1 Tax=Pythium oligandrum TaxID=41045 RepID=A0A8K1CM80_PYTOL|nr:hypothetical protein Poli38472_009084 [Pythium oligandrum]|eukprot:TMW64917.1 hypothetical protein Poli38472_009084 [Pythium oligandrum]